MNEASEGIVAFQQTREANRRGLGGGERLAQSERLVRHIHMKTNLQKHSELVKLSRERKRDRVDGKYVKGVERHDGNMDG